MNKKKNVLIPCQQTTFVPCFVGLIDKIIVSAINLSGSTRQRIAHLGELAISVKKAYWNQGHRMSHDVLSH